MYLVTAPLPGSGDARVVTSAWDFASAPLPPPVARQTTQRGSNRRSFSGAFAHTPPGNVRPQPMLSMQQPPQAGSLSFSHPPLPDTLTGSGSRWYSAPGIVEPGRGDLAVWMGTIYRAHL